MRAFPDLSVSVIIPAYNSASFIARSVASALAQSHRPAEVIVVDDGSHDATVDVLRQFGDQITLISIPNGGVAHARNVGLNASRGQYIAFLDADDIWFPNKLATQLAVMQRHPAAGFCCCNYFVFDQRQGRRVRHFAQFAQDRAIVCDMPLPAPALPTLVRCNFVGTASNVMLTRAVVQQAGGFNVAYRQAEDYDYWLRCARFTQFILVSAPLLEKTTHANNLTNNWLETCRYHELVLQSLQAQQDGPAAAALAPTLALALADIRYRIGNHHFETGHHRLAFSYYRAALRSSSMASNLLRFLLQVSKKSLRLLAAGLHVPSRARRAHSHRQE